LIIANDELKRLLSCTSPLETCDIPKEVMHADGLGKASANLIGRVIPCVRVLLRFWFFSPERSDNQFDPHVSDMLLLCAS
jgi:hypothetical protein